MKNKKLKKQLKILTSKIKSIEYNTKYNNDYQLNSLKRLVNYLDKDNKRKLDDTVFPKCSG